MDYVGLQIKKGHGVESLAGYWDLHGLCSGALFSEELFMAPANMAMAGALLDNPLTWQWGEVSRIFEKRLKYLVP